LEVAASNKTAQTFRPSSFAESALASSPPVTAILAPLQVTNDTATESTDTRRKLQADVVRRQSHLAQVNLA